MAIVIKKESLLFILIILYAANYIFKTFIKKENNNGVIHNVKILFAIAYFWALVSCTLFPILIPPMGINNAYINLNVLKIFEYKEMGILLKNVIGNVILFVPFAFVLYLISGRILRRVQMFCVSIFLSVFIEFLQYIENITGLANFTSRATDIDDIILNVVGAMLGYGLCVIYKKQQIAYNKEK
ncbi:MAG: VanZ family protein [Lachnospiraceae bacterium]|nr:VanZ family protein [Lachnospiraceae bacterium]